MLKRKKNDTCQFGSWEQVYNRILYPPRTQALYWGSAE